LSVPPTAQPPPDPDEPAPPASVGRPFMRWSQLEGALDPPVRPLVEALNRTGWSLTVFSCAGHPEEPDSVRKGRRQAHVDVVVSDERRWRAAVDAIKRRTRGDVRLTEGTLGEPPPWLLPHLPTASEDQRISPVGQGPTGGASPCRPSLASEDQRISPVGQGLVPCPTLARQGTSPCPTGWWRRLFRRPGHGQSSVWTYRRLVFEPRPYDAPPETVRAALNVALEHAVAVLKGSASTPGS
jgi:hypothetical protein